MTRYSYAYDASRLERFYARHTITNRERLLILLFALGHPEKTMTRLLLEFAHGMGPAAVAAGRVR